MFRRIAISALIILALASAAFCYESYGRYGMVCAKRNHKVTAGFFWFAQDDRLIGARWSNGWISFFYASNPITNFRGTDTYVWTTEFYDQLFPDGDVVKTAVANGSSEMPIPISAIAGLFAVLASALYRYRKAGHRGKPSTAESGANSTATDL